MDQIEIFLKMDWPLKKDLWDEIKKQDQSDNHIPKHMFYLYSKKCPPLHTTT